MLAYVHYYIRGKQKGKGLARKHISFNFSVQYDADPSVSRMAVQGDQYENVLTLIAYYQLVSLDVTEKGW